MTSNVPSPSMEYAGVRCMADSICSIDAGRCIIIVPRAEIRRVSLGYGSGSAHPLVQFIFGLGLMALGIPVLVHLMQWMRNGGTFLTMETWLLFFPAIGITLVYGSMARNCYLLIETGKEKKKLPFQRRASVEEIRVFLDSAKIDGYVKEAESPPVG
jgi:hypothetical protein